MIVKLKKLTLKNFKGIKEKEVIFSDKTNISGDNATGKTTIFDAYSWLLWGKDSLSLSLIHISEPTRQVR